jgi:hypothetical protein
MNDVADVPLGLAVPRRALVGAVTSARLTGIKFAPIDESYRFP